MRFLATLLLALFPASLAALPSTSGAAADAPAATDRPKIGLALSGGGAKGFAHIGVLRVLEELRVPVDYIAGTSMGAVVGGLYATGMSADEIERAVRSIDWTDLLEDKPARRDRSFRRKSDDLRYLADLELGLRKDGIRFPGGLKTGQKLMFALQSFTLPAEGVHDFGSLPIPFRCVAADISDGSMVVLDRGDLSYAIRASMAIPGVFSPVELDGRLLVDGGIVNNVPVDVVREMGADLVIALDISGQLATRDELQSFVAILAQTMGLLTDQNEVARLAAADLVIRPDVASFGTLQFDAVDEILARGQARAREQAAELGPLALDEEAWRRHLAARPRLAEPPAVIDFVRFEGNLRVDGRIIQNQLHVRPGGALDLETLAADLNRVYGLGDFELIDFALEERDGQHGLVIRAQEKPWGPNDLQGGLSFDTDVDGESSFALLLNLTATRLNPRGGEWRTDLQIGRDRFLASELYQPLDFRGQWFVAPSIVLERDRVGFFVAGDRIAGLDVKSVGAAVDLGFQFGRFGEMRLGIERGETTVSVATGTPPPGIAGGGLTDVDRGALVFEGTYDRLDSAGIPRQGGFARLRASFSLEDLGTDDEYDKLEAVAARFVTRGRHTFLGTLDLGWTLGGALPVYDQLTLGGFRSLSGFQDDELRGQYLGLARLGYYYRLFGKVYAGGWLEAGNVWQRRDAFGEDPVLATTLMLATETVAGPLYLAYGYAEDGNDRVYLSLGRSF